MILQDSALRSMQVQKRPIPVSTDSFEELPGDEDEYGTIVLLDLFYVTQCLLNVLSEPVVEICHALLWLLLCYASLTEAM